MPTGFTSDVAVNKISFEEFVLRCSRQFGATLIMRDEPLTAPIPDKFEPSAFYKRLLDESITSLIRMENLSPDEIERECQEYNINRQRSWEESNRRSFETRNNYLSMLGKVISWAPPTEDHYELKWFMIEQLESSLSCDCYELPKPEYIYPSQWHSERISWLKEDIIRAEKSWEEEQQRVADRNLWISQLRDSLK